MNERVRELFETQVYPSFPGLAHGLRRKPSGEYVSDTLEDHWQTFQEGFELAVKECANHCDLLLDHKISSEWARGTHDCSRAIKKHFGVEE